MGGQFYCMIALCRVRAVAGSTTHNSCSLSTEFQGQNKALQKFTKNDIFLLGRQIQPYKIADLGQIFGKVESGLPLAGGAGRILLGTAGLLRSEREQARRRDEVACSLGTLEGGEDCSGVRGARPGSFRGVLKASSAEERRANKIVRK